MKSFFERIGMVERLLGNDLPENYITFLENGRWESEMAVPFRGDLLPVTCFLELGKGPAYKQLDTTFSFIHDVLPPDTLPIARDHDGNFFCLVLEGALAGQIVYWDHERTLGDHTVENAAPSLPDFVSSLREKTEYAS